MSDLTSRPYRPNPDVCCEACVFHSGPHAEWCENAPVLVTRELLEDSRISPRAHWQYDDFMDAWRVPLDEHKALFLPR